MNAFSVSEHNAAGGRQATATSGPLIAITDLTKTYRSGEAAVPVLRGISLEIAEGEYVAIMGQSGSGKTTLMNLIGCLDRPSSGSYRFDGRDIARLDSDALALLRRDSFGFVFQRYHLLANASAAENVELPAIYAGLDAASRGDRARQLLTQLGLGERLEHRPSELSGGQQQRVSVARALMNGGRVILADEPTGALDRASGEEVMQLLAALNRAGHTVILITHDAALARHARRLIELSDGRIVSDSGARAAACATPKRTSGLKVARRAGALMPDMFEAVKMAFRSLRANLLRTLLTLLGIVIGVGSVVAMLALGDGSKKAVLSRIEAMGSDLLLVRPGARGVRVAGEPVTLVPRDAEALTELPNVLHAVPEYTAGATLRAGGVDYVSTVNTTTAEYVAARKWSLSSGSFFSPADVAGFSPVAVLGQTVAHTLFGAHADPIGQYVWVNNVPFQVIGVLEPKGATTGGTDMDDVLFTPITTGRVRLFGKNYLRSIVVQVADTTRIDATIAAVEELLARRHNGKVDFQIRNMADVLDTATQTQDTLTWLLGAIAAISLLVGGIGVMNIMLVSVTERIREIGIRIAVGARRLHILLQFNTEALVVCLLGGALGVLGGLAVAEAARRIGKPVEFSLLPIALAFGSALLTGLLFGYLPARKAARLDPVQALAAE